MAEEIPITKEGLGALSQTLERMDVLASSLTEGRRFRIVSDGTGKRTTVVDLQTGADLTRHITGISWELQGGRCARISLVLDPRQVVIDVEGGLSELEFSPMRLPNGRADAPETTP